MRDEGVDVDALDALVRRHSPRLAYLVPTMQNPTGTVLPPHACKRLVEAIASWGDTVVIDDRTLAPMTWDNDAPPPLAAAIPEERRKPLVLTIGSVSKAIWGGLRVVHLPGHTEGHCGFYSARHDLLFSGDLYASYFFGPHLPPPILNSLPELIPGSLRKALELDPRWMIPNPYDILDGELHKRRFVSLCRRKLGRPVELGVEPRR